MGAFSPPSLLFEDFVGRFLVTVALLDESVNDGTGFDMVRGDFRYTGFVGFVNNICCILLLLSVLGMWTENHCAVRDRCGELNLETVFGRTADNTVFFCQKNK